MTENEIATIIVDVAYKIHQLLGLDCWNLSTKGQLLTNWESADCSFAGNKVCRSFTKPLR